MNSIRPEAVKVDETGLAGGGEELAPCLPYSVIQSRMLGETARGGIMLDPVAALTGEQSTPYPMSHKPDSRG